MPKTIRVVRRTPPGEPDKSVGLLPVAIGVVSLITVASGAMLTVVADRQRSAIAESEARVRGDCQQKVENLRNYIDAKIATMWQTFGQNYPSKAEWEARRQEIDRRLSEADKNFDDVKHLLEDIRDRQGPKRR